MKISRAKLFLLLHAVSTVIILSIALLEITGTYHQPWIKEGMTYPMLVIASPIVLISLGCFFMVLEKQKMKIAGITTHTALALVTLIAGTLALVRI